MWAERASARVCFTGALLLLARCLCVPVMPGLPSLWGQGFLPGGRGGGLLGWGFRLCGCSRGSGFQGSRAAVALPLPPARALVPVPCPRPLCPGYPAVLCPAPLPRSAPQPPRFQALLSTLTPPEERRCPPARPLPAGWPARPRLPQVRPPGPAPGLPWLWGPPRDVGESPMAAASWPEPGADPCAGTVLRTALMGPGAQRWLLARGAHSAPEPI